MLTVFAGGMVPDRFLQRLPKRRSIGRRAYQQYITHGRRPADFPLPSDLREPTVAQTPVASPHGPSGPSNRYSRSRLNFGFSVARILVPDPPGGKTGVLPRQHLWASPHDCVISDDVSEARLTSPLFPRGRGAGGEGARTSRRYTVLIAEFFLVRQHHRALQKPPNFADNRCEINNIFHRNLSPCASPARTSHAIPRTAFR